MIPFIDLKPYVELVRGLGLSSFENDVDALLNAHEFIGGGPTTQRFEGVLADKLTAAHAVAVANGTDALQLALRACGIERGHYVAIPNLTFWATCEAVLNVGATPVLLDVDGDDLQLSFEGFTKAHRSRRFDAAILVHLYGWCSAKLPEFRRYCRDKRITLIEDASQAFGVKFDGHSIFEDADVATLSFHPAKVLGGIGDGGAVLTRSARIAARVRALANHGRSAHYEHAAAGWNSRMDAIQAAWLIRALACSDEIIAERRRLVRLYPQHLPDGRYVVPPMDVDDNGYVQLNLVPDAGATHKALVESGVDARRIYPLTIADQPGAKGTTVSTGLLQISQMVAERALCLPLYYGMRDADVARCAEALTRGMK
jgi:UDP-2-acetamido-2-deoxy-ribo-hexuluronate aminotransferase